MAFANGPMGTVTMYKCETCGAPTRPNVDGDIRYDAMKPLRTIERLETENRKLRDVLEWSENNCKGECKGKFAAALEVRGFPVIKVLGHVVNHMEHKDGAIILTVS